MLEAYGFPLLPWATARSPEEAVAVAAQLGFPVALKVLSPDIIHKFDIGGVLLNVSSPEARPCWIPAHPASCHAKCTPSSV
ncbi:MAG: acetate--CoA ligase family protein [Candidatus Kapabacteria bacterium]|nr:acetate--CoA ligase family protein [Candidatus Kapabacteria bacterium]MDW8012154.1 acetate--CoA ligase family protein [Bacteroidota bacterium]